MTPLEKHILKTLNLTPAGVSTLARAAARPDGSAQGRGMGYASIGARKRLQRDGFLDDDECITEQGREALNRARAMGW